MTDTDATTMTKAGVAYGVLQQWLIGSQLNSCIATNGLYTCSITLADGRAAYLVWLGSGTYSWSPPTDWNVTRVKMLDGSMQAMLVTLTITEEPMLLE
jgi:hypothetical protein